MIWIALGAGTVVGFLVGMTATLWSIMEPVHSIPGVRAGGFMWLNGGLLKLKFRRNYKIPYTLEPITDTQILQIFDKTTGLNSYGDHPSGGGKKEGPPVIVAQRVLACHDSPWVKAGICES